MEWLAQRLFLSAKRKEIALAGKGVSGKYVPGTYAKR
jgi:hypothetical protein